MPTTSPIIEPSHETLAETRSTRTYVWVLAVVWLLSLVYMAAHLKRGWVPHDEGTLGLSAERVLQGQLPHRDFDDYTGGLTYLHALAFRVWGINSGSMRTVLLIFFAAWVPAMFYIASRFSPVQSAGAVTLVAVAWSVPNYPGPMPSWYTLFFATWGVTALLRYLEKDSHWWIFAAGLCGGLSMLVKVTGAYYIAGVLLFFVFREQSVAHGLEEGRERAKGRSAAYSVLIASGLTIFLVLLYRTIHRLPGAGAIFYFVVPSAMLVVFLLARELAHVPGTSVERIGNLLRMAAPFLAGVAIPWGVLVLWYLRAGATQFLLAGLVAVPERAIQFASHAGLSPGAAGGFAPFLLWVILAYDMRGAARVLCAGALAVLGALVVWGARANDAIYGLGWTSLAGTVAPFTLAALFYLWKKRGVLAAQRQQGIVLLICVTALCSIVQFPFGGPGYFLYVAPLVLLAGTAFFESVPHPPRLALAALVAFYLLFALIDVTPYRLGLQRDEFAPFRTLALPRAGGLQVESGVASMYEETIGTVDAHAKVKFTYCLPDCPEIYYLAGLKSPSRHYFEYAEGEGDRTDAILGQIEALKVNVVVINRNPLFSPMVSQELESELEKRFPHSAESGKFIVRWKD